MNCRLCGGNALQPVIDLGCLPLPNALQPRADSQPPRYPLAVLFCPDCKLAQLRDTVPPAELFSDYVYYSSQSETFLKHIHALTDSLLPRLDGDSMVLEIGSNDGYLLRNYVRAGIPVLGVDPAAPVAEVARKQQIPTITDFFGLQLSRMLPQADVIHAHNVLAHMPDLHSTAQAVARLLKPDGVFVLEVPYLLDLLERGAFDTIYHEHVYYCSLTALRHLFSLYGLHMQRVEHFPHIHAGTVRVFFGHAYTADDTANRMLENERRHLTPALLSRFAADVQNAVIGLQLFLADAQANGQRVIGYGASAKGNILLNYAGATTLDYIVDSTPAKQGRYAPGLGIPIFPPSQLAHDAPDYVLLLAWNFADEIMAKERVYLAQGGRFVLPIPTLEVIGKERSLATGD